MCHWDPQHVLIEIRKRKEANIRLEKIGLRMVKMGQEPVQVAHPRRPRITTQTLRAWNCSILRMCSLARETADQGGARNVPIGSLIVPITVAMLDAAFGKWTTSALGIFYSLYLSFKLIGYFRVGGPVGENNFKFFIQFTGYTALYCIHLLVVMSIYVRKQSVTEVCFLFRMLH